MKSIFCLAASLAATVALSDEIYLDTLPLESMSCGLRLRPRANTGVTGKPLRIGAADRRFERGVGTHVESVFILEAEGEVKSFDAEVGIDFAANEYPAAWDTGKNWGGASFRVYADGRLVAKTSTLKPADAPVHLHAELKGAKTIVLEASDCGDWAGYRFGHADWAEARFTVAKGASLHPHPDAALSRQLGILTPREAEKPVINGPGVIGVKTGKDFYFSLPASGRIPRMFDCMNPPDGCEFNCGSGILTGRIDRAGVYNVRFSVANPIGRTERTLTFVVGDTCALTPPMGWNSWNLHNRRIKEQDIRDAVTGLFRSELSNHGWNTIWIDDGWARKPGVDESAQGEEALYAPPVRDDEGRLLPHRGFRDMKELAAYIHEFGYRAGIYSSPGEETCAMFAGSYGHEELDARTFAEWGFDCLKYDWCGYGRQFAEKTRGRAETPDDRAEPFRRMGAALERTGREITYLGCQYGAGDGVAEWARPAGLNLWRNHGDLKDSWGSLMKTVDYYGDIAADHAGPGCWCDLDMMVVGRLDTDKGIHESDLSPNEQYTHVSLWCMLAAPLVLGCDLNHVDAFTRNLLVNDEVLAIDQDALGRPARRVLATDDTDVWTRPLADGSTALAVVNRFPFTRTVELDLAALGLPKSALARDLWRQRDLGWPAERLSLVVEGHATALVRFTPVDRVGRIRPDAVVSAYPTHYRFLVFGEENELLKAQPKSLPKNVRRSQVIRFCGGERASEFATRVRRGDLDPISADVMLVSVGRANAEKRPTGRIDIDATVSACKDLGFALLQARPEMKVAFMTSVEELKSPLKEMAWCRGWWDFFYCEDIAELEAAIDRVVARNETTPRRALVPQPGGRGWWMMRHQEKASRYLPNPDVVFVGDSITHFWETTGSNVWNRLFSGADGSPYRALNLGFSGDRTENVLWRLDYGELDAMGPRAVVLTVGGNNYWHYPDSETVIDTLLGVKAVIGRIRAHVPHAKIILHPIFPFGAKPDDPRRLHNDAVNAQLRRLADDETVFWCDFNAFLLEPDGTYSPAMAPDGVHPAEAGYEVWARSLLPVLERALAPPQSE